MDIAKRGDGEIVLEKIRGGQNTENSERDPRCRPDDCILSLHRALGDGRSRPSAVKWLSQIVSSILSLRLFLWKLRRRNRYSQARGRNGNEVKPYRSLFRYQTCVSRELKQVEGGETRPNRRKETREANETGRNGQDENAKENNNGISKEGVWAPRRVDGQGEGGYHDNRKT